jgi:UDP-N-acetylmuramyl tripeptide synthase
MGARLRLETTAARLAAGLSRAAGRGGGTTLPGKLVWKIDPGAVDALAARLPHGAAIVSATNGKTTSTAMAARVLGARHELAWNRAGANLASGVASTLLAAPHADLGLLEVDEFALPEIMRRVRPRTVLLGNLFRDQLDRYGELEHIAERWLTAVGQLDRDAVVIVNADDPLVASLAEGRSNAVTFGIADPSVARPALQHASDSKYCVRCGTPYSYDSVYVGHLGDYRCPACEHSRPPLAVCATNVRLDGLETSSFDLVTAAGTTRVTLPLPGLYNVYNALGASALALALGCGLEETRAALAGFSAAFGRFERIDIGGITVLVLLVKNPAGANEIVRTLVDGAVPPVLVVALNDEIADGRDVSWIWDVDFEPLLDRAGTIIASGTRAEELALRFTYVGFPRDRLDVIPTLGAALDRGLELTAAGGTLGVLPTYTAMLALRGIVADRGLVRPYWETSP